MDEERNSGVGEGKRGIEARKDKNEMKGRKEGREDRREAEEEGAARKGKEGKGFEAELCDHLLVWLLITLQHNIT